MVVHWVRKVFGVVVGFSLLFWVFEVDKTFGGVFLEEAWLFGLLEQAFCLVDRLVSLEKRLFLGAFGGFRGVLGGGEGFFWVEVIFFVNAVGREFFWFGGGVVVEGVANGIFLEGEVEMLSGGVVEVQVG